MAVPRMPKKGIASVAAAWPADCSRPKGNGANLGFEAKLWATGQRADQHTRRRPSVDGISLGREEFFVTNKWNSNCQRPMVNNARDKSDLNVAAVEIAGFWIRAIPESSKMPMRSPRWTAIAKSSQFPWEREALDWLRAKLPDRDLWHAWTNFEFIDDDGKVNEVDALGYSAPAGFSSWKSKAGRV